MSRRDGIHGAIRSYVGFTESLTLILNQVLNTIHPDTSSSETGGGAQRGALMRRVR